MKTKTLEKLDTIMQMGIFYLSMLSIIFIIAMIMGKSLGRTQLPYGLMTSCIINLGAFTLCLLLFMTDFIFVNLKYWKRIAFCIVSAFILIEAYTVYRGILMAGNPVAYFFNNQMLFLEFIFLFTGWLIYSKLTTNNYQKMLTAYQNQNTH